jgi:hypothetical protein
VGRPEAVCIGALPALWLPGFHRSLGDWLEGLHARFSCRTSCELYRGRLRSLPPSEELQLLAHLSSTAASSPLAKDRFWVRLVDRSPR